MSKLVCWACGASLKDIPLPFTRLEQCKNCRADLHVCRLCRYYNPNVFDKCDHELAEPARELTVANFCHYFRPRPGAFQTDKKSKSEQALAQLKTLFGETEEPTQAEASTENQLTEEEKARRKFESLFKDQK
jgi:hypothetical protein